MSLPSLIVKALYSAFRVATPGFIFFRTQPIMNQNHANYLIQANSSRTVHHLHFLMYIVQILVDEYEFSASLYL